MSNRAGHRWMALGSRAGRSLTEHLTWWLVAAGVIGVAVPGLGGQLRSFTSPILAVMIGGLGLTLRLASLTASLRNWKLLGMALVAQLISTPLFALLIWNATGEGSLAQGLVVQATAPSEVTSPLMAYLAGGSLAGAISILGVSVLLAPLTMPLLLRGILGQTVPVPAGEMLVTLVLTVAIPLLIGSTIHSFTPGIRQGLTRFGSGLSAAMVVLLVFAVAAGASSDILAHPADIVLPALLGSVSVLAVGLLAGWAAGLLGRLDIPERRSVLFTTGMREFGIATAIALSFFDSRAAIFSAIYGIIMMIATSQLARRLAERQHRE